MNRLIDKIYKEKDIATNISVSVSMCVGLLIYLTINNSTITFLSIGIAYPITKVLIGVLLQKADTKVTKNTEQTQNSELIENLSEYEKQIIWAFLDYNGPVLPISLINSKYPFNAPGVQSLMGKGLLEEDLEAFFINENLYQICKKKYDENDSL